MKKYIILTTCILFILTGCAENKAQTTNSEIKETNNVSMENNKVAEKKFTDEEKSMMAGKTSSEADNTEQNEDKKSVEQNGDVKIINGKDILIYSDISLNSQKDGIEYSELKHVTYYSNTCEKERGMNIQLPSGYSEDKEYPVMYVLHGIFGDEYSMCGDGKSGIPALVDNMIEAKEAEEMIVVYPFMYASKDQDQCTAIDDKNVAAYDNFINELVNEIMPYMKENYSIKEGKENTAVTGFSMGGREALAVGLYRPDLFGYIGAIAPAPGLVPGEDMHLNHPGQFSKEEVNYGAEKHEFIMICSGDKDSVVGTFPKSYHELYDEHGIEHIWWEVPGSDHGDPAISSGIYNFTKYIFK